MFFKNLMKFNFFTTSSKSKPCLKKVKIYTGILPIKARIGHVLKAIPQFHEMKSREINPYMTGKLNNTPDIFVAEFVFGYQSWTDPRIQGYQAFIII